MNWKIKLDPVDARICPGRCFNAHSAHSFSFFHPWFLRCNTPAAVFCLEPNLHYSASIICTPPPLLPEPPWQVTHQTS